MKMFRRICWTSACMGIFLMAMGGTAFGETAVIYQKTYQKEYGRPVAFVDRFQVPTGVSDMQMIVTNGVDPHGEVRNISIELNGTEIVSNRDLKGNGSTQKAVVHFDSSNVIEVTLRGPGGNTVNIQLVGEKEEEVPPPILL